jgi:predicted SprT family Zn-dependent metalloprotease
MTKHLTLLSPELKAKVEAAVEAAFVQCEKHYGQKFKRPEVRYDIRNTNGGEAWLNRNLIRLNLTFLVENEKDFIASTVPHEVAHLVAHYVYDNKPKNGKKVRPHGVEWKEVMGVLSLEPKVKHSYDLTSLDLHKKKRKVRALKTAKAKIDALLKQISKLEYSDREYLVKQVRELGDE